MYNFEHLKRLKGAVLCIVQIVGSLLQAIQVERLLCARMIHMPQLVLNSRATSSEKASEILLRVQVMYGLQDGDMQLSCVVDR